jgi:hypothetical protein
LKRGAIFKRTKIQNNLLKAIEMFPKERICMADLHTSPDYLHAGINDIASLSQKLLQFAESLSPVEQSLLMERIKRSMPGADVGATAELKPSLPAFAAWLNSIVSEGLRWHPE